MPLQLGLLLSVVGADINGSSVIEVWPQCVRAERATVHHFTVRISSSTIALVTVRNHALFPITE